MRAGKSVLVTLSVLGGLVVSAGIILLPAFVGAALAVAVAMLWCWWLEHQSLIDENTFGVWSYPFDVSTLRRNEEKMEGTD